MVASVEEGDPGRLDGHHRVPVRRIEDGKGSARALHSPRLAAEAGPFAAISCAALPEQLFESELFAYG